MMQWGHGIRRLGVLCAAGMLLTAGCAGAPVLEVPKEYVPSAAELEEENALSVSAEETGSVRETLLYYGDGGGYIIPVMRTLPWSEGIAEEVLRHLTAGSEEELILASRGLEAPIPAGTVCDVEVHDGVAYVDMTFTGTGCDTLEGENAMVVSVVNSMMELSTVDAVVLTVEGQAVDRLPLGTPVSARYDGPMINVEPMGVPMNADGKILLCFANETGSYLVPVWRIADAMTADPALAVKEMLSPMEGSGLVSLLPPTCRVLDVQVEEGTARVNFSEEFMTLSAVPALENMALRGLRLALTRFEGIEDVTVAVEGIPYEPTADVWTEDEQWLNILT